MVPVCPKGRAPVHAAVLPYCALPAFSMAKVSCLCNYFPMMNAACSFTLTVSSLATDRLQYISNQKRKSTDICALVHPDRADRLRAAIVAKLPMLPMLSSRCFLTAWASFARLVFPSFPFLHASDEQGADRLLQRWLINRKRLLQLIKLQANPGIIYTSPKVGKSFCASFQ
eukprot:1160531-Pelagomonas_calceolata.AAC.4